MVPKQIDVIACQAWICIKRGGLPHSFESVHHIDVCHAHVKVALASSICSCSGFHVFCFKVKICSRVGTWLSCLGRCAACVVNWRASRDTKKS